MKFGVREICDVVLKAKANQKIGNKIFYKHEPVVYFDTLKSSGMEGSATTVYAQGGRGNARLMAWEGERTVTFTMEDALISPEGFMILSGAGLIEASAEKTIKQHMTQTVDKKDTNHDKANNTLTVKVDYKPYIDENHEEEYIYAFVMKGGEIVSEPYLVNNVVEDKDDDGKVEGYSIVISSFNRTSGTISGQNYNAGDLNADLVEYDAILVDYYTERASGAKQIEITADKFGGNYYLEASTLFRDTNGVDMPAEFVIPNCKIQSNFSFNMASSGDPSTFTFTMDAFPDYTRFDHSKKVLAAIQIIEDDTAAAAEVSASAIREATAHNTTVTAPVPTT